MDCPRCFNQLTFDTFKGMEILRCGQCDGLWLEAPKLGRLEDTVAHNEDPKGTLIFRTEKSEMFCPVCYQSMQKFNYRDYDLVLDFCPEHGYWLDKGEEKRVLELMKEETEAVAFKTNAEDQWADTLLELKTPSFWNRLTSSRRS